MKLYHFTKNENVERIIRYGLATSSKNKTLNSKRRECAVYCWLEPEHDLTDFSYKNMRKSNFVDEQAE